MSSDSVYAKPAVPRIIVRPALASITLHALLLGFLVFNWAGMAQTESVKITPTPKVINPRLVDVSEFQPKPKPKPVAKPKPKQQAAVSRPKPKPPAAKPKPAPKVTSKPKAAPKPKPKPKPEPRITEQELAAIARADLARAMAAEEEAQVAEATATAQELAASYSALIAQTVTNYWCRPPSARNGMEALLQIQLVPTGEVVSVRILQSSGDAAFDRSAENAVQKAGSFPELQNLPPREFEKTFRRFRLLFTPEDLRY